MKKTVSILTALLLAVSPAAQRAYAQEATVQVQQNVEESKVSKVWNTVKGYAGKAANAVAENKGAIAGAVGVTGAVALLGAGSFATYNGVILRESIKTIWAADGITMAQKVQLIARVLFLRKEISAAELANLKNQNIISASNAIIKENESVIGSADEECKGIDAAQKDLGDRKKTQEKNKYIAMCRKKAACGEYNKALKDLGIDLTNDKTCKLGEEYNKLDCIVYDHERCDCGKLTEKNTGDCENVCPKWDESSCKCGANDENKNEKCVPICEKKLQSDCKCGTSGQLSDEKCKNACPALTQESCKCGKDDQLTLKDCGSICKGKTDNKGTTTTPQ